MSKEGNYSFSAEKNAMLKQERGVNFDDAIYCIENGYVLDVIRNKTSRYAHQEVYIIELNGYAYVVPFVRDGDGVFLKTMHASREMTRRYLGKDEV